MPAAERAAAAGRRVVGGGTGLALAAHPVPWVALAHPAEAEPRAFLTAPHGA